MDLSNPDPGALSSGNSSGVPVSLPAPPPGAPPPPARLHKTFFGPDGLRAGWSILIFLVIAGVVVFLIGGLLSPLLRHRASGITNGFQPASLLLGEGIPLAAVLIAAAVMARIERRSFHEYGLSFVRFSRRSFARGIFWGWLALTALLLVIGLLGGFSLGSISLSGWALIGYAGVWAVTFLVVGLFEEFGFRGYLLATLSRGIGFWPAAVVLSVVFGSAHLHNAGEDWAGALAAGLIGLFFCFTLRRSGSLWFAVGFHAAWDYAESFLYAVPDSGTVARGHLINSRFQGPAWLTGGSVGPEASVFVFAVIVVAFAAFGWFHGRVEFPRQSPAAAGIL